MVVDDFFGYWLGASDMKRGQWLWNVNFKPVRFTKWNSGEPNGSGSQCLHMIGHKTGKNKHWSGKWNDHACETNIQYICKKSLVSI